MTTKKISIFFLLFSIVCFTNASPHQMHVDPPKNTIEFNNIDWGDPNQPCKVRIPSSYACDRDGCLIKAKTKLMVKEIRLNIQCFNIGAPTQFDNPSENLGMKFKKINGSLSTGYSASYIDNPTNNPRLKRIGFCLFFSSKEKICGQTVDSYSLDQLKTIWDSVNYFLRKIDFSIQGNE